MEVTAKFIGVLPKTVKRKGSVAKARLFEDLRVHDGNDT
jgi:hypothetical protein